MRSRDDRKGELERAGAMRTPRRAQRSRTSVAGIVLLTLFAIALVTLFVYLAVTFEGSKDEDGARQDRAIVI
jgi:hypothetical protein